MATEQDSAGVVLALVPDQQLLTHIRSVLARAGVVVEPCASEQECEDRLKRNGVAIVLVDSCVEPEAVAVRIRAQHREAQIIFLSTDQEMMGPQDASVYCREDVVAEPQQFVDAIVHRLNQMCLSARVSAVSRTGEDTKRLVTDMSETLGEFVVTQRVFNDSLSGPGAFPRLVMSWFTNRDPILWWALTALVGVLLSVAAYARVEVMDTVKDVRDVPEIRRQVTNLEWKVDRILWKLGGPPPSPSPAASPAPGGGPR